MKLSVPPFLRKTTLVVALLFSFAGFSQSFLITYPSTPEDATACNEATLLTVKMNVIKASTTGASVTINLAEGMEYETGSINKIGGTASLTITENGGTANQPQFLIGPSTLALGNFIEFTIRRKAICAAYDNVLLGEVFRDQVIGDIDGTLSNEESSPYSINYPSLTFIQPTAINNALIGDAHTRTFNITNGADGCANAVHFSMDYTGGGITQQSLQLGGTVINPTSIVGNVYNYTISGSLLTADAQLCNGESLTFTETIQINDCAPETIYNWGWGCNSDPNSWCNIVSGTGVVNMVTGSPQFKKNTNTKIGYVDMCTPFQVQTEFENGGTGNTNAATMYNITLRKGRGQGVQYLLALNSSYSISNATLNSQAVPWTFTGRIFEVELEDYFTVDPDGPGVGLEDVDGDGFYDDLPKDSEVSIVMDVSINCNKTCGSNKKMDNFAGAINYTTMCSDVREDTNRLYANGSSLGYTQNSFVTTGYVPANIDNNVPFRARFSIGYYRQVDDFDSADSRYVYEITLPTGVSVSGTGNIEWRTGEYPSSSTPVSLSYTQVGNVLTITSPKNAIGYALIDLVYNCASGSNMTIDYQFRKINNPATGCACQDELACGSLTANASCPGTCVAGPSSGIPVVRRADNSLGWVDATMTTKQVASNINAYDLSKALYLDEIEVHGDATQNGASVSLGARLSLPKVGVENKLTPIEIEVSIERGGSVVSSGTLSSFTMANSTSVDQIIDWDLNSILPSGGLLSGDEITTLSRYQVTSNSMTQHDVQSGGEWYFYNTDPIGGQIYCNSFIPEMYLVGTRSLIGTNGYFSYGCDVSSLGGKTNYLARRFDTSGFYYQSEYRPVMYVESIEAVIPDGYDFVGATIQGGGVLVPDAVSGNTYTFNNPGTWPGVGLTVANSYGRHYPFEVRATCATESTERIYFHFKIKDYYYHYADDNPTSTEYEIIKTNTRTINHYEHPEISLSNLTGDIQASESIESWTVRMANNGSKTAPYNWIALDDVANVQIIKVVDVTTGLDVSPTAYPGGNLYLLGADGLDSGTYKDYRIDFSYTSCTETSIKVLGGWNCTEYPTDPNLETCSKEELDLIFTPANGEVEVISVVEPSSAIDICTPLDYEFNVNSVQSGNIKDTEFSILAPQGMHPVSGSFEAEYPVGSGNWEPISLGLNTGSSFMYDLTTHSWFPTSGLPGTLNDGGDANLRLMAVRFKMTSDCDFVAGSNFQVSVTSNNICGTPAVGSSLESQTVSTSVSGVAAEYSVVTNMNVVSGSFDNCNTPVVLEGTQTIITSDPIGSNGFVEIELPLGYEYVANSYSCNSTYCATFNGLTINTNGKQVVRLLIPAGMDSGDVFSYTFEVVENTVNFISCGTKTIAVSSQDETQNITCATETSGFCPVLSVQTGSYNFDFNVDRAALTFTSTSTTATIAGVNESVTANFTIENNSSFDVASGAIIEAIYDTNQNGVYDIGETILSSKTLSTSITATTTISESLNLTIPASQVCSVILGVRTAENYCFCADEFTTMVIPSSLEGVAGNDTTVCEIASSTTIGNPIAGYSYQWAGASSAETGYLDNPLSGNPVFTYNGTKLTSALDIIYTVTITRPNGCRSTDTMMVSVRPSPDATVTISDASCGVNNGSISLAFDDYTTESDIEFSLDNGNTYQTQIADSSNTINYFNLAAGSYHIWARWGDDGCPVDLGNYTINSTPEVAITSHPMSVAIKVGENTYFNTTVINADTYQWQVSLDNGVSFANITNGSEYSGVQSASLLIIKPEIDKNNYQYRVLASNSNTPLCNPEISNIATLLVQVNTIITNRRITHRVRKNK